jgi:hypothetical protein
MYTKNGIAEFGGADGIRTHDLLDAIEARSQLRHGPTGETTIVILHERLVSVYDSGVFRLEYRTYGKTHFSGRSGIRYRFKISGRSGRQAVDGGLRHFSGLAGTAGPQLQAADG